MGISLAQIKSVCGEPTSKSGNQYTFACPICQRYGHDLKAKNNLQYNEAKQIFKCFADNSHTYEILDLINNKDKKDDDRQNVRVVIKKPEKTQWEINKDKYFEYQHLSNKHLLQLPKCLEFLKQKRGLTKETIELTGMGYDHTENKFVIPIYSLKHQTITDFEMRLKDDNKKVINRVGGGCSTIACIYGTDKADTLYIVEGFIDGYVLTQWLLEKGQKDFSVYTPSNGVSSLFNCLSEIKFNNFKKIKLILDNDEAGDKETKKILDNYPFMIDSRKFLKDKNIKDICDYYNKIVLDKSNTM